MRWRSSDRQPSSEVRAGGHTDADSDHLQGYQHLGPHQGREYSISTKRHPRTGLHAQLREATKLRFSYAHELGSDGRPRCSHQ
eukprot:6446277-Pyramimonas_sp.AAC.1